ncbi:alanine dehydrogenase [Rhizorhapis sp.]|uniref:alanine dehydrogenase n=1 Tax=Rhizorhapis sp. TaxID=1968842 RepID=UPI002B4A53FD|nr:alanine dehydrogenase [Rhizorhapis sp.]HKR16850.1 alanine dehydrogenase [Rhizorhapis sp.]
MIVGTVREIKNNEYRVGLTPESVHELAAHGHQLLVESGAGQGIGATDHDYRKAGAEIVAAAAAVFDRAEFIVKVKEPQEEERALLKEGQILFTYLHLAPDPEQTKDLIASGAVCIAYETVTDVNGGLPLLKPMSQVAGRMSIQAGATALEKVHGGRGVLLGGVPGVMPAKVAVIGGGVVGFNAAQMAAGLGADVTILDRNPEVLERLGTYFEARAKTRFSNKANIADSVAEADLIVGAVLVDVAIDQGGCFETSEPTTHDDPTYIVDGIVHYCVTNMPGAVARTSTYALNNVTLPHALRIADLGWKEAMRQDRYLLDGLNVWNGKIICEPVARELGYAHVPQSEAIA